MSGLISLALQKQSLAKLAGVVGFTYAVQTAFAIPAISLKTEKFYDLAGSLGFISSTILSAYYPAFRSLLPGGYNGVRVPFELPWKVLSGRQMLLSGMVLAWSGRLGSFLAARIHKAGSDSRFDEIKLSPPKFAVAWFGQATWITLASLPLFLANALPKSAHPALGLRDLLGLGVWAGAFGLEVLADRQKSKWREEKNEKKHDEKFIKSGVWSWSRHPNYVGEVSLWAGLALTASTALSTVSQTPGSSWWFSPYIVLISPLFEYILLTQASGVPILEKSAEKKWGNTPEWKEYKSKVPVFFAWPGSKI